MYLQLKLNLGITLLFSLLIFFNITNASTNEKDYFLTLKNNKVNLRDGPSKDYPIILVYKKKYLPVEILDSWENWRKIRDIENNSGWIHIALLSKKKSAINQDNNSIIFSSNTVYSQPLVKVEKGRLLLIKKCNYEWCKVTSGGYIGWMKKKSLWGKIK